MATLTVSLAGVIPERCSSGTAPNRHRAVGATLFLLRTWQPLGRRRRMGWQRARPNPRHLKLVARRTEMGVYFSPSSSVGIPRHHSDESGVRSKHVLWGATMLSPSSHSGLAAVTIATTQGRR